MTLDDTLRQIIREEVEFKVRPLVEAAAHVPVVPSNPGPIAVDITEAARLLSMSTDTVHRRIKSGDLAASKTGDRDYRVRVADIEAYLARTRVKASDYPSRPDIDAQVARIVGSGSRKAG